MSWNETFHIEGVSPLVVLGVVLASYCLGCFTTGYYLVRLRTGLDVRRLGSGSTGARNAGRTLGWPGFVLTTAGDVAKGMVAVWGARELTGNDSAALLAWLAVVAGHIWPAQLGFRGGKGVVTSLAGLLIYDWRMALAYGVLFALALFCARRSLAASFVAYASLPAVSFWLGEDQARILGISVVAGVVILAHYRNMAERIHEILPGRGVAGSGRDAGTAGIDPSVEDL